MSLTIRRMSLTACVAMVLSACALIAGCGSSSDDGTSTGSQGSSTDQTTVEQAIPEDVSGPEAGIYKTIEAFYETRNSGEVCEVLSERVILGITEKDGAEGEKACRKEAVGLGSEEENPTITVKQVKVDGDSGSAIVTYEKGPPPGVELSFIKVQDGNWKIDGIVALEEKSDKSDKSP